MSLYPSLEDMSVDKLLQGQRTVLNTINNEILSNDAPNATNTANNSGNAANDIVYPHLGKFLGLELSEEMIRLNMPEYINDEQTVGKYDIQSSHGRNLVTGASASKIPASAEVNHSIRELILCKDKGKIGLRVQSIENGIFVSIVVKNSPAALAGLRFGDQILQLNGILVCGFSVEKIHSMFKSSGNNNISVVVRDRPFERNVTLVKDSKGGVGFQIKNGEIKNIVKDSSAARNGVVIKHHLLEVNGQSVVAMKDKEVLDIIAKSDGNTVKITIIPTFIFDHLVKKLSTSYLRTIMDRSIPDM